jgi:hypothetical protein
MVGLLIYNDFTIIATTAVVILSLLSRETVSFALAEERGLTAVAGSGWNTCLGILALAAAVA